MDIEYLVASTYSLCEKLAQKRNYKDERTQTVCLSVCLLNGICLLVIWIEHVYKRCVVFSKTVLTDVTGYDIRGFVSSMGNWRFIRNFKEGEIYK